MVLDRLFNVRCCNCRFVGHNFVTGLHGQGLYRFGTCERLPHDMKVADPDAVRECEFHEVKEDAGGGETEP